MLVSAVRSASMPPEEYSRKRKFYEKEGEEDDVFREDAVRQHMNPLHLEAWRRSHPIRAAGRVVFKNHGRPSIHRQRPWESYRSLHQGRKSIGYQCLLTPFLVPTTGGRPSQTLADAPGCCSLFRPSKHLTNGTQMEHYTNIHRMEHLARSPPLVGSVVAHNVWKQWDERVVDGKGRALENHQSPHDLRITLAASGASMLAGCTVNKVAQELLSLWWSSGSPYLSDDARDEMQAVFFDITEAYHITTTAPRGHSQSAAAPEAPSASASAAKAPRVE